jgi:hypothetical protein
MAEPAQPPRDFDAHDDGRIPLSVVEDHYETVRVRRSPKYAVFLAAGAALGIIVALILTFTFTGTEGVSPNTGLVYSQGQVFGFLLLVCLSVGLVLGGVVALILDRLLGRRTHEVTVDRETVHIED